MPDNDPPANQRIRTVSWQDPKTARREVRRMSGLEFFTAMQKGEIPEPPFGKLLGIDLFESAAGRFVMTLEPHECHYNPMGCVHGGILATLLDSVMSAAVHTSLPAGKGYLTLEIKINFQRPVFAATGEIMAEGKVVWISDPVEMAGEGAPIVNQVATAEGKIIDSRGLVHATGTCTCMIYDAAAPPPRAQ